MTPKYDVVVVGAGVLGVAAAYHLKRRRPSLSVLVLDAQGAEGRGSTSAAAAMVRDVFSSSDNWRLAHSSIEFYRSVQRSGVDLGLDLYGYLWLLREADRERYASYLDRNGGLAAEVVDVSELAALPGLSLRPEGVLNSIVHAPEITGGLFGRSCGAINPAELARYYREAAQALGVEFRFDSCVTRLSFEGRPDLDLDSAGLRPLAYQEHESEKVRVSRLVLRGKAESVVSTDRVVVTAGAWADQLLHPLGFSTACSPRRRLLFSVGGAPVEEFLRWRLPNDGAAGTGDRTPFVILPTGAYVKPMAKERHAWLGYSDHAGLALGTSETIASGLGYAAPQLADWSFYSADLLPQIAVYLPSFQNAVRQRAWGGYYNYSSDGLPILEEEFGIIFLGGDSGSGIMKADALGRLVASRYLGEPIGDLFGGIPYPVEHLGLKERKVETERIIL